MLGWKPRPAAAHTDAGRPATHRRATSPVNSLWAQVAMSSDTEGAVSAEHRGYLAASPIQREPALSSSGDLYEREADSVADQMRMTGAGGQLAFLDTIQRSFGNYDIAGVAMHTDSLVADGSRAVGAATFATGNDVVFSDSPGLQTTAHEAAHVIQQHGGLQGAGDGQVLDSGTRAHFEARLGHDFSRVRLHTSAPAAQSARAVGARAYTLGNDVVFGPGEHHTSDGGRLLAHELVHVVQQSKPAATLRPKRISSPDDDDEHEADTVATAVLDNRPVPNISVHVGRGSGGAAVQRKVGDPMERAQVEQRKQMARRIECSQHPENCLFPWEMHAPKLSSVKVSGIECSQHPESCLFSGETDALGLPPAAKVRDNRTRLDPTEKPLYDSLLKFLDDVSSRINTLVAAPPANAPWLTMDNGSVATVLRTINSAIGDLRIPSFAIRFDYNVPGAFGEYDKADNLMRLRAFTNDDERVSVSQTLLHEYTHLQQDKHAEELFATQKQAREDTREDAVDREIEGRRVQVYFSQILQMLRIDDGDISRMVTNADFFRQFEQQRTGAPAERTQATKKIHDDIASAYAAQHLPSYPRGEYVIEIDQKNHAVLYASRVAGTKSMDLVGIPKDLQVLTQVLDFIEKAFRGHASFPTLVMSITGQRYPVILLTVIYGDAVIGQRHIVSP